MNHWVDKSSPVRQTELSETRCQSHDVRARLSLAPHPRDVDLRRWTEGTLFPHLASSSPVWIALTLLQLVEKKGPNITSLREAQKFLNDLEILDC